MFASLKEKFSKVATPLTLASVLVFSPILPGLNIEAHASQAYEECKKDNPAEDFSRYKNACPEERARYYSREYKGSVSIYIRMPADSSDRISLNTLYVALSDKLEHNGIYNLDFSASDSTKSSTDVMFFVDGEPVSTYYFDQKYSNHTTDKNSDMYTIEKSSHFHQRLYDDPKLDQAIDKATALAKSYYQTLAECKKDIASIPAKDINDANLKDLFVYFYKTTCEEYAARNYSRDHKKSLAVYIRGGLSYSIPPNKVQKFLTEKFKHHNIDNVKFTSTTKGGTDTEITIFVGGKAVAHHRPEMLSGNRKLDLGIDQTARMVKDGPNCADMSACTRQEAHNASREGIIVLHYGEKIGENAMEHWETALYAIANLARNLTKTGYPTITLLGSKPGKVEVFINRQAFQQKLFNQQDVESGKVHDFTIRLFKEHGKPMGSGSE